MILDSDSLSLKFDPVTGGLAELTSRAPDHAFLRKASPHPLIWRIHLRGSDKGEVTLDNSQLPPPKMTKSDGRVVLEWERADLPGEAGALDVKVTCDLKRADDTAFLHLQVRNRSAKAGLWSVEFPVIAPLSEPKAADIAVGRGNWGVLYQKADSKISGEYPSNNLPMQFMLLQEGESGLYLAAHDPAAWPKNFELEPGGAFSATTFAANMGVPGSGWSDPFPFAIGVYRGDWMTGCKRYRAWALKSAPWTKKGPISRRKDVSESMKRIGAWIQASGSKDEVVPVVSQFAKAIGAPVGVHWYNWHQIPFDTDYPAYFPAKPGFSEGAAALKKEGVVVMPYINARLWDSANREFPEAKPHSAKDEAGNPIIEEYGSGAKLAVMCPTQEFWRKKVYDIVRGLVEREGVNAVYLDQIASAPPRRCFDPSHGHPIGSGPWWVSGYHEMLAPIKKWTTSDGRHAGLTTENDAEPYMDDVDGFLIWTPRDENEIPMMTAVYGGYALYFGSNHALGQGAESYCLLQARDFVWGSQLGWDGPGILDPAHGAELGFLSRLAKMRGVALDYLAYGELLETLKPTNDVPEIAGRWEGWSGTAPVRLKAVQGALWRSQDGSFGTILANADSHPHAYSFVFQADRYAPGEAKRWKVTRKSADGEASLLEADGGSIPMTAEIPARDAVLLTFRPEK